MTKDYATHTERLIAPDGLTIEHFVQYVTQARLTELYNQVVAELAPDLNPRKKFDSKAEAITRICKLLADKVAIVELAGSKQDGIVSWDYAFDADLEDAPAEDVAEDATDDAAADAEDDRDDVTPSVLSPDVAGKAASLLARMKGGDPLPAPRGRKPRRKSAEPRGRYAEDAVIAYLRECGALGATRAEIVEHLDENPPVGDWADKIKRTRHSAVRAVLWAWRDAGKARVAEKHGLADVWRLVEFDDEAKAA